MTRTQVMGIVNVTPDSFSDGGRFVDAGRAVQHAQELLNAGADVLDIGGESTRPGAVPVSVDEECARVLPVVRALANAGVTALSVDTRNAETAERALQAGARWINDVSALQHDAHMVVVARAAERVVLMHAREMGPGAEDAVHYDDVVQDVRAFLEQRCAFAEGQGIPRERLVVDPGIGFGKSLEDNLALTRGLAVFRGLGAAVLYGPSRKRFLGTLVDEPEPARRDAATVGALCFAAQHGADLVRVHDVRGAVHALTVFDKLRQAW